jgi:FkbM family methyltransferase
MTRNRLKVFKHFFAKSNGVTLLELIDYFFAPSYRKIANSYIKRIEYGKEFNKIYFKNITDAMYYPKDINLHSLHLVTVESFNSKNWHYYEIPETVVMADDVVVDCGSAEGLFALKICKRCKHIYIIEPLKKFVECLQKTFDKANNVEILPFAISDKEYYARILNDDISSALSTGEQGEEVKVTTLDNIFFARDIAVSYLKMDLEGHDYKALVGAENVIRKNKPKIAITTYHKKEDADKMELFLKSIVPEYNFRRKGIYQETGSPVMLHAWI